MHEYFTWLTLIGMFLENFHLFPSSKAFMVTKHSMDV
jgi:hypothetical protein